MTIQRTIGWRAAIAAAALIATGPLKAAQQPAEPGTFVVHLSQPVDPAKIILNTNLLTASGSHGNFGVRGPRLRMSGTQDIVIDTATSVGPATGLRAVVYCLGYQMAFVDVPSLADASARRTSIDLQPLGDVELRGRAVFAAGERPQDFRLIVDYDIAPVVFEFEMRGLKGGFSLMSSSIAVAEGPLGSDGTFSLRIPDVLADPHMARHPKTLTFFARNSPTTGHPLVVDGPREQFAHGLPVARAYPPIVLKIE